MNVEYGDEIDVIRVSHHPKSGVVTITKIRIRPNRSVWRKKITGNYKGETESASVMQLWGGNSVMWDQRKKIVLPTWKLNWNGVELDYVIFASQPASCTIPVEELTFAYTACQADGTPPAERRSARI
jgi:hypothetical protein